MKIMIFGRPGSGKSTFAYKLHKLTKIPIHHLDKYFFTSNWKERDYQVFLEIQNTILQAPSWIIDGNATRSLEMRYSKVDICLYFNFPKWICLYRLVKRLFFKNANIDDRADCCPEIIRWQLVKYLWTFEIRVQKKILELKTKYPNVQFIELSSNKKLDEFLKGFNEQITHF